jgi:hypothetical protein
LRQFVQLDLKTGEGLFRIRRAHRRLSKYSLSLGLVECGVVVLFPHVRDKHWLLVDEQVDETTEHGSRIIDARIGSLAEEV